MIMITLAVAVMALGVIVCNHMIEIARLKNKIDRLIQEINGDNAENTDTAPRRRRRRRRKRKEYIEQQEFKPGNAQSKEN